MHVHCHVDSVVYILINISSLAINNQIKLIFRLISGENSEISP
jgi:hypothetical protein